MIKEFALYKINKVGEKHIETLSNMFSNIHDYVIKNTERCEEQELIKHKLTEAFLQSKQLIAFLNKEGQ